MFTPDAYPFISLPFAAPVLLYFSTLSFDSPTGALISPCRVIVWLLHVLNRKLLYAVYLFIKWSLYYICWKKVSLQSERALCRVVLSKIYLHLKSMYTVAHSGFSMCLHIQFNDWIFIGIWTLLGITMGHIMLSRPEDRVVNQRLSPPSMLFNPTCHCQ